MTHPAIRVEGLAKKYIIGAQRESYGTLRDALASAFSAPLRRRRSNDATSDQEFWALRRVNFAVPQGQVVGVIGRNGAGKSTLLKVLSRITEPTLGRIRIRGRVASLLEVGTGFHAELTGRENLFLNGAILGMSRQETARKFDEIVAFAEVEKFIDTPVKRYSSGMYLRLAFAIAAHLEPDILIVDEVLAVGDTSFQNKCIGKMEQVASHGRTVLFVSHNMASIRGLCSRCLWMHQGELRQDGVPGEVVESYLAHDAETVGTIDLLGHPGRRVSGKSQSLRRLTFSGIKADEVAAIPIGAPLTVQVGVFAETLLRQPRVSIWVTNMAGERLFTVDSAFQRARLDPVSGHTTVECTIPELCFVPGRYTVSVGFGDIARLTEWVDHAATFHIVPDDYLGVGRLPPEGYGTYLVKAEWATGVSPELAAVNSA